MEPHTGRTKTDSITQYLDNERAGRIRAVVVDHLRRCQSDDSVTPEETIQRHPDLMPDLANELHKAQIIDRGRLQSLEDSSVGGEPDDDDRRSTAIRLQGDAIPGYEIVGRVRRGGQGTVYEAIQKSTQRRVAVKVLGESDFAAHDERSRFEREVRVLGALKHPNIVTVHESGTVDGRFYLVMDFVEGNTLDRYLANRSFSMKEKLDLFRKICDAVHAAHLLGIIHRDLKPSNIRVDREGRPCILDFGLAKFSSDEAHTQTVTMPGQFVGSLLWASPEQVGGGRHELDLRTDVYALGVILFHMLTGQFPYPVTGSAHNVMESILHIAPRNPRTLNRAIDDEVKTIVLKCLSKERDRRYQTGGELGRDVQRYLTGRPIEAKRDSTWYVVRKTAYRYKYPVAATALLLVLLSIFGIAMSALYQRAAHEAQQNQKLADQLLAMFKFDGTESRRGQVPIVALLDRHAEGIIESLEGRPETLAPFLRVVISQFSNQIAKAAFAQQLAERLLQLDQEVLAADADRLATDMGLLARTLFVNGHLHQAERRLDEAIQLARNAQDSKPVLVRLLELYGFWIGHKLGDMKKALPHRREAVRISRSIYSEDDPRLAIALRRMASYLHDMSEFEEAERLYLEALRIQQANGVEAESWYTKMWIGVLYKDMGRYEIAESHLLQALAYFRKRYGEMDPSTGHAFTFLAKLYADMGDWIQADEYCGIAIETEAARVGGRDTYTAVLMTLRGRIWINQERYAEAEKLLRKSLAIQIAILPEKNWERAKTASLLGAALAGLGRFEEGEPLVLNSYPIIRDNRKIGHRRTAEALDRIVFLYDQWGKHQEAEQWRKKKYVPRQVQMEGEPLASPERDVP